MVTTNSVVSSNCASFECLLKLDFFYLGLNNYVSREREMLFLTPSSSLFGLDNLIYISKEILRSLVLAMLQQ